MFQVGLPCYPGLNSGQSKRGSIFQKHLWRAHVFPKFPIGENFFSSVGVCFQDANYAYATGQGISTRIRACEHFQNFFQHSSNFCEQFEQRPNFGSTFKLDETIRYHFKKYDLGLSDGTNEFVISREENKNNKLVFFEDFNATTRRCVGLRLI